MKCPPRRFLRIDARDTGPAGRLSVGAVLLAALLFELALPALAYGLSGIGGSDGERDATAAPHQLAQTAAHSDAARAAAETDPKADTCCGKCCCAADQRNGGTCCCAGSAKPRPAPDRSEHHTDEDDGRPKLTCRCGHSPATVGSAPDMPKFCGRPAGASAPAPIVQSISAVRPRLCCADLAPETPPPKPKPLA